MGHDINGVMMQYFEWYIKADGSHYKTMKKEIKNLANAGVTALWIPPSYKGNGGGYDVGYAVYDKYDLGEFDQKGSVRTKYGTKDELKEALAEAKKQNVQIYADIVFNHRIGGDETEMVMATPYDKNDRYRQIGPKQEIKVYTKFTFAGRKGAYSSFCLNKTHFDSVNYNALEPNSDAVWLFEGQKFERVLSFEKGNYDFLMGCDLDMDNPETQNELIEWGKWFCKETGADGFRLDAIKHIPYWFYPFWLDKMNEAMGRELFCVGEYWSFETNTLLEYIRVTEGKVKLFDAPLQNNFKTASVKGKRYDMRRIFDGSIVSHAPTHAVTIVENHDTQPLQALENTVEPWFKPIAYALILLRRDGYPCLFYADYYGSEYEDYGRDGAKHKIIMSSHKWIIDKLLRARRDYAYGTQLDYFDHPNTIGWSRLGDEKRPKSMAVVVCTGDEGYKWMYTGKRNTKYFDLLEHKKESITTNKDGYGRFTCKGGSVSVWVEAP